MNREVRISALMPIRNGEKFLSRSREMIEKCLNKDDELIIIDDGSSDNSLVMVEKWATENSQVRVVKNSSPGLVNALNLGVIESNNNWIARFDVDDIYPSHRLQSQRMAIKSDVGAIFSDYEFLDLHGISLGFLPSPIESHATSISLINGNRTPHPSALFSKEVFQSVGGYRSADYLVEDLSLWLRMTRESKIVSIPEILLYYSVHSDSISIKKQQQMVKNKLKLIKSIGICQSDTEYCKIFTDNILKSYESSTFEYKRTAAFVYDFSTLVLRGEIKTGINIKTSNAIIKNFIKFGFAKAIVDLKLEQIKRRKYRIA